MNRSNNSYESMETMRENKRTKSLMKPVSNVLDER